MENVDRILDEAHTHAHIHIHTRACECARLCEAGGAQPFTHSHESAHARTRTHVHMRTFACSAVTGLDSAEGRLAGAGPAVDRPDCPLLARGRMWATAAASPVLSFVSRLCHVPILSVSRLCHVLSRPWHVPVSSVSCPVSCVSCPSLVRASARGDAWSLPPLSPHAAAGGGIGGGAGEGRGAGGWGTARR